MPRPRGARVPRTYAGRPAPQKLHTKAHHAVDRVVLALPPEAGHNSVFFGVRERRDVGQRRRVVAVVRLNQYGNRDGVGRVTVGLRRQRLRRRRLRRRHRLRRRVRRGQRRRRLDARADLEQNGRGENGVEGLRHLVRGRVVDGLAGQPVEVGRPAQRLVLVGVALAEHDTMLLQSGAEQFPLADVGIVVALQDGLVRPAEDPPKGGGVLAVGLALEAVAGSRADPEPWAERGETQKPIDVAVAPAARAI